MATDELLTAKELAVRMNVTDRTVRNWVARGRLVPLRMGRGTVRFSWTAAIEAMEKYQYGGEPVHDPAMG